MIMHKTTVSPEFRKVAIRRRNRIRLYDNAELYLFKMALLVIDMQYAFCDPNSFFFVKYAPSIVPNINRISSICREFGVKVIWVQHTNRPDGSDWPSLYDHLLCSENKIKALAELGEGSDGTRLWHELIVQPGDIRVSKCRHSALIPGSSNLERILRSLDINTLIITGTRTNCCCESTCRDAFSLDFKILFAEDATATNTDEEHQAALNSIVQFAGDVLTTNEIINICEQIKQ